MGIDLTQTLLLQALGKQPAEGQSIPDLAGDPDNRTNLLMQFLAQRQAELAKQAEEEEEISQKENQVAAEIEQERNRLLSELREKSEQMFQELEVLRTRNDQLASSLGACYLCWGEDPGCQVCGGRGKPGYYVPNRGLFEAFFLPAARRIQRISQRNGRGETPRQNGYRESSQPVERREL